MTSTASRKRAHETSAGEDEAQLPESCHRGVSTTHQRAYYWHESAPTTSYWSLDELLRRVNRPTKRPGSPYVRRHQSSDEEDAADVVKKPRYTCATDVEVISAPVAAVLRNRTGGPASDSTVVRHHVVPVMGPTQNRADRAAHNLDLVDRGDRGQLDAALRASLHIPTVLIAIVGDYALLRSALLYRPPVPTSLELSGSDTNLIRLRRIYPAKTMAEYTNQPAEAKRLFDLEYRAALRWIDPSPPPPPTPEKTTGLVTSPDGSSAGGAAALHRAVAHLLECKEEGQLRTRIRSVLDVVHWRDEAPAASVASSSSSSDTKESTGATHKAAATVLAPPSDMNVFGAAVAHAFVDTLCKHLSKPQLDALDYAYYARVDALIAGDCHHSERTRTWWSGEANPADADTKVPVSVAHLEDPFQFMHPLHCMVRWAYRLGSVYKQEELFEWVFACARNLTILEPRLAADAPSSTRCLPTDSKGAAAPDAKGEVGAAAPDTTVLLRTLWIKTVAYALANILMHRAHRIKGSISYSHTYIAELLLYSFTPLCDAPNKEANHRPYIVDAHRLFFV